MGNGELGMGTSIFTQHSALSTQHSALRVSILVLPVLFQVFTSLSIICVTCTCISLWVWCRRLAIRRLRDRITWTAIICLQNSDLETFELRQIRHNSFI